MKILRILVLFLPFWNALALTAADSKESRIEDNPYLLKLLELSNINHNGSLEDIVLKTQKEWLRKGERWEVKKDVSPKKRGEYLKNIQALGYIKEISAKGRLYNKVLFLGSSVKGLRKRLSMLAKEYRNGLRFEEIVILGSERPLNSEEESPSIIFDENNPTLPLQKKWIKPSRPLKTELEAMIFLIDSSDIPIEIKKARRIIVNSKMKMNKEGKLVRPTTPDTIVDWLKQNDIPRNTTWLVVSNQPYCHYQHLVVLTLIASKGIKIETIGPASNAKEGNVYIYLDSLARHLYQEKIYREIKAKEN